MEKYKEISQDSIKKLMEIFYGKIRVDKNGVGDIFNQAIGTSDEAWEAHKRKIGSFWEGMFLGTGDFKGAPLKAHLDLPPFPREYFEIWIGLFTESLDKVFEKEAAEMILQRAQMIRNRFEFMLYDSGYPR